MTLLSDILTGRLLKLRLASGVDVLQGTSNRMLVTPKSIADAGLLNGGGGTNSFSSKELSFVLNQTFFTEANTFVWSQHNGIVPPSSAPLTGKLFVFGSVDFGTLGEACLWDVATLSQVPGSVMTINTVTSNIFSSAEFPLPANKAYTFAIKRITPLNGRVNLRSALLLIK